MTIMATLQEMADKICKEYCKHNELIAAADDDDDRVEKLIKNIVMFAR